MASPLMIAVLAASTREGSLNIALLETILPEIDLPGISIDRIDFSLFEETPHYSARREKAEGIPDQMKALADRITGCRGLVIVTPEYNQAVPGTLKNGIDWLSRISPNLLAGKPTLICGASGSPYGAWRGMSSLRPVVEFLGALTLPYMISVGGVRSQREIEDRFRQPAARAKVDAALATFRQQLVTQAASPISPAG